MDLAEERSALCAAYRDLAVANLLPLSAGNLSLRAGDAILITPTGADAAIRPEALVLIDGSGAVPSGGVPSSEWAMHAAIYAARPDAAAVVHTHGDCCTAVSCLRRPLPPFHYMLALFGGDDVPCVPYAPFGSTELAESAASALAERSACLLANHGMICHGASIAKAAATAITLEMLARQYLLACGAGTPVLLTASEMAEARRRFGFYGRELIPPVA